MIDIDIVGVVLTYNRVKLLLENINSCLSQSYKFTKIYIIDNGSEENVYEELNNRYPVEIKSKFLVYYRIKKNCGSAGGFNEGLKFAYEHGHNYYYLMDDDGRPMNTFTIEKMKDFILSNSLLNRKLFLNSLVLVDNFSLSFGFTYDNKFYSLKKDIDKIFYKNVANPFNGTLISKTLIECIGYPKKEYYMGNDEMEYFYRSLINGAEVYTVCNSLYFHPSPNIIDDKGNRNKVIPKPWRVYYSIRNECDTIRLYEKKYKVKCFIYFIKYLIKILLYSKKSKILSLKLCIKGYSHFKKGILGTYITSNGLIVNELIVPCRKGEIKK